MLICSKNTFKHKKTPATTADATNAWQRPTLTGGDPPTTLGAMELDFCVRNGNRYILHAIVTTLFSLRKPCSLKTRQYPFLFFKNLRFFWLSPRPISNGPLHASPHFHFHPIYLIISQGS